MKGPISVIEASPSGRKTGGAARADGGKVPWEGDGGLPRKGRHRRLSTGVLMTTANKITIFRILLIPLFVFELLGYRSTGAELHRWLALSAFGLAAILDGVDGYVARRFDQRSELGAVLDPTADKLLLVSAVILLSLNWQHLEPLPLWFGVIILSRDVILSLGSLVIYHTVGRVQVQPRWTGKVAAVLQMSVVIWAMLRLPRLAQYWVAAAAALCTGISGVQYLFDGMRQLSSSPLSQPSGKTSSRPEPPAHHGPPPPG